jgi:hypothetical protein
MVKKIKSHIDELGQIYEKIKELQSREKELKEQIIAHGEGEYIGEKYKVAVSRSVSYEYDNEKLFKRLGSKKYIKCSKIHVTSLKKYIAPADLDKFITASKESFRVSIKPL